MLKIRWGRIVFGAFVAEVVPIVLLVAIVAAFGPRTQSEAQLFAERLGEWVGPIGGTLMCFLAALWAARKSNERRVLHGVLVGVGAALLDVGVLLVAGAGFEWLFVASNIGRIAAGTAGGIVANRKRHRDGTDA